MLHNHMTTKMHTPYSLFFVGISFCFKVIISRKVLLLCLNGIDFYFFWSIYIYMYEKTWPHFITYCFVGSCFLQSVGICGLYLLMNVKVVEVCVQESICFVVVWVSCHFVVPEMWYRVCGFISVFCAFSALTNNMHCSTVTTANCLQNKKIKLCQ